MRHITISILGLLLSQCSAFLRRLDEAKLPKFYSDNAKINYSQSLGCGACIRGGYIYCIPGPEGSDPATWPAALSSVCCQDSNSCPEVSNVAQYNCSNSYADTMLAKGLCPFNKANCGGNSSMLDFNTVGDSQKVSISLQVGDTCHFEVRAECGLPMFSPNDTTGFEIESVEYDEDDLTSSDLSGVTKAIENGDDEESSNDSTNKYENATLNTTDGRVYKGSTQENDSTDNETAQEYKNTSSSEGKKEDKGDKKRPPVLSKTMQIQRRNDSSKSDDEKIKKEK